MHLIEINFRPSGAAIGETRRELEQDIILVLLYQARRLVPADRPRDKPDPTPTPTGHKKGRPEGRPSCEKVWPDLEVVIGDIFDVYTYQMLMSFICLMYSVHGIFGLNLNTVGIEYSYCSGLSALSP